MAAATPPTETASPSTRQWLTERQSATVDALLDAGFDLLREVGFDRLSLREVARRAGVTHTTAYSYFTSKEHLVAELTWRLLQATPPTEPSRSSGRSAEARIEKPSTPSGRRLADRPRR